ncbi:hypothetical protein LCM19_10885 [Qipengyuania flava]|nr:hypothetical protein [Qipengyuania flava]
MIGDRHFFFDETDYTYRADSNSMAWHDLAANPGYLFYAALGSGINPRSYYAFMDVRGFRAGTSDERFELLVGSPTLQTDFPASGVDRVRAFLNLQNEGSELYAGRETKLVVDYNRKEISGILEILDSNNPEIQQSFQLQATFDPAQNIIVGSLTEPTNGATGEVIGSFYGPYAVDFASSAKVTLRNGTQLAGGVGATRN